MKGITNNSSELKTQEENFVIRTTKPKDTKNVTGVNSVVKGVNSTVKGVNIITNTPNMLTSSNNQNNSTITKDVNKWDSSHKCHPKLRGSHIRPTHPNSPIITLAPKKEGIMIGIHYGHPWPKETAERTSS